MIAGAGRIDVKCPKGNLVVHAYEPDRVKITGPTTVKVGGESDSFSATLFAGESRALIGDARLEWSLGPGCEGHATFGPVLGAQDTGGADRTRKLRATAAGKCQIDVIATTTRKAFQGSILVTLE